MISQMRHTILSFVACICIVAGCVSCTGTEQQNAGSETYQSVWKNQSDFEKEVSFSSLKVSICAQNVKENIEIFEGEDSYYFFLPSYADTTNIRFDALPSRYTITYQGVECNPEKEMQNLRWGECAELALADKESGEIETHNVTFLKSENINALYINTSSGNLDAIHEDKEYQETGDMVLYTVDGELQYQGGLTYLSGRGNQTWGLEKRPYQMKLEKKADLLGMGAARKWILLANILDPTFIRNKMVYDMAKEVGLPYSPESEFVDLYINGQYVGNYQISEKIEVDKERVDIYDLDSATRNLNGHIDYENMQAHESEDQNQKWIDMENNPEDITGGYLIERDYWEKYGPEKCGFKTSRREHFVVKSPAYASRAEVEYIRDIVQQLEDALYSPDGINPYTGKHYTEYIDLESWAKKYIIEEFSKNEGGGTTSTWFYKPDSSESDLLFAGPVWDYDKAFGQYELSCFLDPRGLGYLTYHHYSSPWYKQFYTHEDYVQAVKKYYQEDFRDYFRQLVDEKIDIYAERVRASAYMDHIRWQSLSDYWMFDDFDESVAYLKDFISKRTDYLDEVWVENKIYYMVKFKVEGAVYEAKYVEPGEVLTDIPDLSEKYDDIVGWCLDGTEDEMFDVTQPITEDITVYLKTQE